MDKGPRSQPLSLDRLKKEESLRKHYGKGQKKKGKHIQEQQRLRGPRGGEPISPINSRGMGTETKAGLRVLPSNSHLRRLPPPPQSGQEPSDQQDADARYDIKEATEAEELASAARKRQQEEESWHESLWRDAVQAAVRDDNRPRSARELVREGKMRDWWSMSWGQCKELVDGKIHDHYRSRLSEMFAAQADSKPPDAVVDRFSAVCAYFQQRGISLEHEEGLEMTVFKVPGQKVACVRTKFEGPSYSHPRNARFTMVASHGMPFPCAMGLAEHGELCPGDHVDGEYPQYGFSARGTCDDFTTETLKQSIGKVVSKAKGMGQIVATQLVRMQGARGPATI